MQHEFFNLNKQIHTLFDTQTVSCLAVKVGLWEEILYESYFGSDGALNCKTLFDMASITKIVSATSLTLLAMQERRLGLSDRVADFFPDCPCASTATIQELLTHRIGLGYLLLPQFCHSPQDAVTYILSQMPVGGPFDVEYSCPAFILLGKILEQVWQMPLDRAFVELVAKPLGMRMTSYCPDRRQEFVNGNASVLDRGIVADKNCRWLGGVAGNAGVFSNMEDMSRYAQMLLRHGQPLINRRLFDTAIQNHTYGCCQSRGLGFQLADRTAPQAAGLFTDGFGHCGHTGQSLYLSPTSGLWVLILSDATAMMLRRIPEGSYDEVMKMRTALHCAIRLDLQSAANAG